MFAWLNKILNRNTAPVVVAPAPAPVVTEAPARVITGTIMDTRHWKQETPGWAWDGTRIDYATDGHSSLVSPAAPSPIGGVATFAATMACDTWGAHKAKGYIVVMGYTKTGGMIGLGKSTAASSGTVEVRAIFPPEVVEYTVALIAIPSRQGGTSDGALLKVRFVNLTMDLAA